MTKRRIPQRWQCGVCGVGVVVYVVLKDPPTHLCRKRSGHIYGLEPKVQEEEA